MSKYNAVKNINPILILVIIFLSILYGCNARSKKGQWSDADKKRFYKVMGHVDLSGLGVYKTKWLECYLKKIEANYSSLHDANSDEKGVTKLALECSSEIIDGGSVVGQWSASDCQKFYKEMESVDLSGFGENKTKWLECYLKKAEANYSSFREANADEKGIKNLAHECSREIFDGGSVLGKWSESDKQQFYKAMEGADLSYLGKKKKKWIECYLKKAEANYSSFREANADEQGCKNLAKECSEEIIK